MARCYVATIQKMENGDKVIMASRALSLIGLIDRHLHQ